MRKTPHFFTAALALLLSTGLMLIVAVGSASAHAKVPSATPGIGAVIATAPTSVAVTTAENMNPDPRKSNLFVYSPTGELISQGNAKIPLDHPKEMSISIKASGAGVYIVRWITVSADDGNPNEGAFIFTVNPNKVMGTTRVAAKSTTPATKAPAPSAGTLPFVPLIATGAIALLVGLGVGSAIGRSRSNATLATTGEARITQPRDEAAMK
ncbi:hypothetical protein EPA93_48055 [Ktedonosporobacter rubrisoli]|uniref:CopC domain-containing protein n=1 Tax=Ktedonosporobacter rubrisoli TaxID=2509675 RepID=A0A4P6K4X5_KTERU|nr:copper resistance protein CopC [Ktedonosporobacter rubrisoli]QBD83309.1 hypothetical protein EPA93_48055 [Ktedonosporobacter rubrisoli]